MVLKAAVRFLNENLVVFLGRTILSLDLTKFECPKFFLENPSFFRNIEIIVKFCLLEE